MAALGDQPAAKITSRDVEAMLKAVAKTGVSPSSVNKHRARVVAVFNYGMRGLDVRAAGEPSRLPTGAASRSAAPLAYYSPEEIEALARALEDGNHREPSSLELREEEPKRNAPGPPGRRAGSRSRVRRSAAGGAAGAALAGYRLSATP